MIMRTVALCCTIAVLVVTVALWIKKSRQVRGNHDRDATAQRKRMVKFYGSAVGLLFCYCILILAFDGPAWGAAAMAASEMLLLRKAITI